MPKNDRSKSDDSKFDLKKPDKRPGSMKKDQTDAEKKHADSSSSAKPSKKDEPNPPRTTSKGWFTAPKFGSAGSGGAEFEPGPEKD